MIKKWGLTILGVLFCIWFTDFTLTNRGGLTGLVRGQNIGLMFACWILLYGAIKRLHSSVSKVK